MGNLRLERPAPEHKARYEAMMDEWAIRRHSDQEEGSISYEHWLRRVREDRETRQDLYFLMKEERILGAISIRYQCAAVDGHCGYGIRPSERRKGYATAMLALALPLMRAYGIHPIYISCAKDNIGSAKTILNNGGKWIEEVLDEGEQVSIYQIDG